MQSDRTHHGIHTIVACLVMLSITVSAYQYDRATNGGFELDVNRDGQPDAWKPALFDSPAAVTWDDAVAHSGTRSVRIDDSRHAADRSWKANTARWVQTHRKPVTPSAPYTVEGWLRTRLSEGKATITIAWFSDTKWLQETSTDGLSDHTEWTAQTLTVQAPAEATSAAIYLILHSGRGSAWFDDITMVEGSELPADFEPVDLRQAANTSFRDETAGDAQGGWTDQGRNDARRIPVGMQTWRGIPFRIIDARTNGGAACIMLRGKARADLPDSATFRLGRACTTIYFLHAAAWAGRKGTLVARYVVRYADGTELSVPLHHGREITDWWDPTDTDACVAGWRGENPETGNLGLVIFPWLNPHPQKQIRDIAMVKANNDSVPFLAAATTANGPAVFPEEPLPLQFTDTRTWYEWAFDLDSPELGELDLSHLLDAPAGKHGFIKVAEDGHFAFEDGTTPRFFGTNVGGRYCAPSKDDAIMLAKRFAAHGINLLRLHSPDSRWGGLIDYSKGDTRTFDKEWLDRYDYFVAQLKKQGIYVYFDLLDYRDFLPGDGVRDAEQLDPHWSHSVKGASIFDRRMIELQKEFATQLLTHRNPYTGNRYVDEPALVLQEITNENSLFYVHNQALLLPSYRKDLAALWNRWLLERYADRTALAQAWTNAEGQCALLPEEDPAAGTVHMPTAQLYADLRDAPYVGRESPARCNALTRFLYEQQQAYYDEMSAHLRSIGLRCPITGTNQDFSDAGNRANAVCDVMTRNNYWCHPNRHAKPFVRFSNAGLVASNIAMEPNPIANVCSSTVAGKPMVSPEFNSPWPNEWRAELLPLMVAYGRLQDWDGLLYFAYSPEQTELAFFGNQSDPVRWGHTPMAALVFHRADIAAARLTVHIGCSDLDTSAVRPQRTRDRYSPYRVLSYISKVRNAYFDDGYEGDADIAIASGHSAAGDYSKAKRAIVFADSAHTDEFHTIRDRGHSARQTVSGLRTEPGAAPADTRIDPDSVPAGAERIEFSGQLVGFIDDRRLIYPCASQTGAATHGDAWLHDLFLRATNAWSLPGATARDEAGRIFRSDTGELVLDREVGLFTAVAPRVRMAVGFLRQAGTVQLGTVTVQCQTPFAALTLIALDEHPIETSRRLLLTAVARAENTGQACLRGKSSGGGGVDADTGLTFLGDVSSIAEKGRTPVLVEPVDAVVDIPGSRTLQAFPLSPTGQRRKALETATRDGRTQVPTREARSPWVLLTR